MSQLAFFKMCLNLSTPLGIVHVASSSVHVTVSQCAPGREDGLAPLPLLCSSFDVQADQGRSSSVAAARARQHTYGVVPLKQHTGRM